MQSTIGSRAFQKARQQKKLRKQAEPQVLAALVAYRNGRHAEAQALCQRLLQDLPDYFDALHLLGVSVLECGRFAEAAEILARAVALAPGSPDAHSNYGWALFNVARYEEARNALEKSLRLRPSAVTTLRNLANTLLKLEKGEAALATFLRVLQLKPDDADAWCNRAVAELMLRRWDAAAASSERALALRPRHFESLVNKGLAHLELRHFDLADETFNAALAINPRNAELLAHRGRLRMLAGHHTLAEADFDVAIELEPTLNLGWQGKAQISLLRGNVEQAIIACKRVLDRDPNALVGLTLLGACFGRLGDTANAIAHFDRALAVRPDYEEAISKKIFYLDFCASGDFVAQQAARHSWWEAVGSKLARREIDPRSLDPERRIVVGYVSADFRKHSAAFAFLPVLRSHDKQQVQINCYSSSTAQDSFTDMFRSLADVWCQASDLSDDELADRIQADKVDILIDLSGHTAGNRLGVFARKPAPIQVTGWGNGTGTGIKTIDYLFADPVTIPEEVRHLFAERVYDLPSLITIDPILDVPPCPPPMLRNGHVTFGVYNRIDKISDQTIAVWSRLLHEIQDATIVIKHLALDDALVRNGLLGRFDAHGIAQDRIICIGTTERSEHLRAFEQIDISLDPFPQNGGISTWESLYMGVPVVAKLGNSASSRLAAGIVKAVGLESWIAKDEDEYIRIAKEFASQPKLLEALRSELPPMIARSAAGDPKVYAQHVEAAYRKFWREYCASIR